MTEEQRGWLEQEVARLERCGAVDQLGTKRDGLVVALSSPTFLVPKKGPKRWRLVFDLRRLNETLPFLSCKMETVSTVARLTKKGWWAISFDLSQGYFHLDISLGSRRWMGFKLGNQFYRYRVLPFGLTWAPYVFTKVVKAMLKEWRKGGVHCMAYIDDFVVMAEDPEELCRVRDELIAPLLERLGWVREPSKGEWDPVQRLEVLGLIVDLSLGTLEIPGDKLERARKLVLRALRKRRSNRQLAELIGYLSFLARAAPELKIVIWELHRCTRRGDIDWERTAQLTERARRDLDGLLEGLGRLTYAPLWRPSQVTVLCTDASLKGWGAVVLTTGRQARGAFPPAWDSWPIHFKEMVAVLKAVKSLSANLAGNQVEVRVDNRMVRAYLANGGGRDSRMHEWTREILGLLAGLGAKLYSAIWVKGELDNWEADALSRWVDGDDWQVKGEVVGMLRDCLGHWEVDRFANKINKKAQKFWAVFACPGAAGVDTFSQWWDEEVSLLVPPLYLWGRVLRHLWEGGGVAIALVPRWEMHWWWPLLLRMSVKRVCLGGSECFERGLSGKFALGDGRWTFEGHLLVAKGKCL
eukprot:TRINITY_DN1170_c0_g1_i5.p2 TRINITY_DN1170_c0_g1~~TRINITY_DN1170_c0_g1_i5.p2  ORF type:complete len:582 (-),score=-25.12 TRINITY_DN1170_c0_g1_i5:1468-3213(-)